MPRQAMRSMRRPEALKPNANTDVLRIKCYIKENIYEINSLEDIQEEFSLSKEYLCRLFKANTGTTILSYISLTRMHKVRTLYSQGYNLTEACYQAGYQTYSCFYKQCVKLCGMTPQQFVDMELL